MLFDGWFCKHAPAVTIASECLSYVVPPRIVTPISILGSRIRLDDTWRVYSGRCALCWSLSWTWNNRVLLDASSALWRRHPAVCRGEWVTEWITITAAQLQSIMCRLSTRCVVFFTPPPTSTCTAEKGKTCLLPLVECQVWQGIIYWQKYSKKNYIPNKYDSKVTLIFCFLHAISTRLFCFK